MFFNNWGELVRIVVTGVLAYGALVAILRTTGKRTLSKMNMFDLIVTVALGSVLATIVLSKDTTLVTGIVAIITLVGMQFIITWLSMRSTFVLNLVKARPKLLYYRGEFLKDDMRSERVPMEELYAALRDNGFASFDEVRAVVLETNGQLSVVPSMESDKANVDALTGVVPEDRTPDREFPVI